VNPYNPYQAPQMNDPSMGGGDMGSAQAAILESMKKTRPWVMFLSILGFLGAGGMVLMGLIVMVMGSAMSGALKGAMPGLGPALGLIYMVLGGLYVVPSL